MDDTRLTVPPRAASPARRHRPTQLEGRVDVVGEPLESPASGAPCVWFCLRIHERLVSGPSLVHEIASDRSFELAWQARAGVPAERVRVDAGSMQVSAAPVIHEPGSAGARAVAARYGLPDGIRVEEIAIRPGECVLATGLVDDVAQEAGPFRSAALVPDLTSAHLELPSHTARAMLMRTAVLPWALGTAAAIAGGMGLSAWAVHTFRIVLGHAQPTADAVVAPRVQPALGRRPAARPRLP